MERPTCDSKRELSQEVELCGTATTRPASPWLPRKILWQQGSKDWKLNACNAMHTNIHDLSGWTGNHACLTIVLICSHTLTFILLHSHVCEKQVRCAFIHEVCGMWDRPSLPTSAHTNPVREILIWSPVSRDGHQNPCDLSRHRHTRTHITWQTLSSQTTHQSINHSAACLISYTTAAMT